MCVQVEDFSVRMGVYVGVRVQSCECLSIRPRGLYTPASTASTASTSSTTALAIATNPRWSGDGGRQSQRL